MKKIIALFSALFFSLIAITLSGENISSIIIRGGYIYDGSLNKQYKADVMISGDKIVFIGDCSDKTADKIIDATGCVVAPGFIDPHSHSNVLLAKSESNSNENMLQQGVTTVLCGVCGSSPFPISKIFDKMTKQGIGTNCGFFVGHGTIRNKVLGNNVSRPATAEEMQQMKKLLSDSMDEGAFGLSTGLYYAPGSYSSTEEVIELAKAMSDKEGIYSSHIRSEGAAVDTAIKEAIRIGKEADVQVNISHIKMTRTFEGKAEDIIKLIEDAQKEGLYITADQYPYIASSTTLRASVLPRWAELGGRKKIAMRLNDPDTSTLIKYAIEKNIKNTGGPDAILISKNCDSKFIGKTLNEAAKILNMNTVDAAVELIKQSDLSVIKFSINEKAMSKFMERPWVMTGTDGSLGSHPRATGTYPTKIQNYVLKKNILSMTDMIHRSSGMVAKTYGIEGRGFIKEGCFADVIVFKPENFKANSNYIDTKAFASGMKCVIINGKIAIEESKYNGTLAGVTVKKKNSAKDISIFENRMNKFLKENNIIGVIASVVKDNRIIYTNSFGKRDIEGKTSFRQDHKDIVRIASISKSFCATALMQLVESGKLSLDQEIGDIMGFKIRNPKYPDNKITISMLLSHTSSLNDSQGYKTLDKINPAKNPKSYKCYSDYQPGKGYKYCNLNFNLLGAAVEKISGMRYDEYIKRNIIDPLKMHASLNIKDLDTSMCVPLYSYDVKSKAFRHRPEAYYPLAKSDEEYIMGYDPALFSTTGGMKCDVESLARYMMMHMNYGMYDGVKIMSETSSRLMQSKQTTTDVKDIYYCYAMRNMDGEWIPDVNLIGHTGSAYGMVSTMTFNPLEKYGFVTLCNGYSREKPTVHFDRMLYYHFIYMQ